MRRLAIALLLALTCSAFSQRYSDQDRFGKTESQVVSQGKKAWIGWFTDPARGGESGRAQAINMYAMALYTDNKKRLESWSAEDRKFFDDVWIDFANIAKSAMTITHSLRGSDESLSVFAAESSSWINELISKLLDRPTRVGSLASAQVYAELDAAKKMIDAGSVEYAKVEVGSLRQHIERCAKRFDKRSKAEQALFWSTCMDMVKVIRG